MTGSIAQQDKGFLTYPTSGWRKAMFKWPVQLWRLGLGPLLGKVLVLITHTGRKSGLPRHTLAESHYLNGRLYAPSGFGRRAQWYRNIEVDPHVTIQTAAGTTSATAVRVTTDEELLTLLDSMKNNPNGDGMFRLYLETLGIEPNQADILAKKDRIYWLRFDPTNDPTPPPLEADLLWVWPVLGVALLSLIGLFGRRRETAYEGE